MPLIWNWNVYAAVAQDRITKQDQLGRGGEQGEVFWLVLRRRNGKIACYSEIFFGDWTIPHAALTWKTVRIAALAYIESAVRSKPLSNRRMLQNLKGE